MFFFFVVFDGQYNSFTVATCCFYSSVGAVFVFVFLFLLFQVMAIVPSHSVWQRERSEHHSGAQRQYSDRSHARMPRGPAASPVSCDLCNHSTRLDKSLSSCSPSRGSSAPSPTMTYPQPFTSLLTLEATPPRATSSCRKAAVEAKCHSQHSSCCCPEEVSSKYH